MSGMTPAPGQPDPRAQLGRLLEEDPADLYENAPMGYLSALPDGRIVKVNRTFCAWTGRSPEDLLGVRFQDLLTMGGRVFHETHVVPLLRMQGAVREIAMDVVRRDGSVLPCLINAVELRDDDGAPVLMRATLFEATARRRYERELLAAQRAAEESEARSRTVQRVVSDMAAATSVADVAAVVVERGREALKGSGAALVLVEEPPPGADGDLPLLYTEHSVGLPADLLDALQAAATGKLALELAQGVRTVALDQPLRAGQPGRVLGVQPRQVVDRARRGIVDEHQRGPAALQRLPAPLDDHRGDVGDRGRGGHVGDHPLHRAGARLGLLGRPLGGQQFALVAPSRGRLEEGRAHEHGRAVVVPELDGVDQAGQDRAVHADDVHRDLPHRALHAQQRHDVGLVEHPAAHGEQVLEPDAEQILRRAPGPGAERPVDLDDPAVGQRREVAHRRVLVQVGRVLLEEAAELRTRIGLAGCVAHPAHPVRKDRIAAVVSSGALRCGTCPVAASWVNVLPATASWT